MSGPPRRRPFYQSTSQTHYGEAKIDPSMIRIAFNRVQNCELDEFIRLVSDNKLAMNIRDAEHRSFLHACINPNSLLDVDKRKRLQFASYLVSHGASVAVSDIYGVTPLHLAVKAQDRDLVKLILSEGADVNVVDAMKFTPLHYSVTGLIHPCTQRTVGEFIGHGTSLIIKNTVAQVLFDEGTKILYTDMSSLVGVVHELMMRDITSEFTGTELQIHLAQSINTSALQLLSTKYTVDDKARLQQNLLYTFLANFTDIFVKRYDSLLTVPSDDKTSMVYFDLYKDMLMCRQSYLRSAHLLKYKFDQQPLHVIAFNAKLQELRDRLTRRNDEFEQAGHANVPRMTNYYGSKFMAKFSPNRPNAQIEAFDAEMSKFTMRVENLNVFYGNVFHFLRGACFHIPADESQPSQPADDDGDAPPPPQQYWRFNNADGQRMVRYVDPDSGVVSIYPAYDGDIFHVFAGVQNGQPVYAVRQWGDVSDDEDDDEDEDADADAGDDRPQPPRRPDLRKQHVVPNYVDWMDDSDKPPPKPDDYSDPGLMRTAVHMVPLLDRLLYGWSTEPDDNLTQAQAITITYADNTSDDDAVDKMWHDIMVKLYRIVHSGFALKDDTPDYTNPNGKLDRRHLNALIDHVHAVTKGVMTIIDAHATSLYKYLDRVRSVFPKQSTLIKNASNHINNLEHTISDHRLAVSTCITHLNELQKCLRGRDGLYWAYHLYRTEGDCRLAATVTDAHGTATPAFATPRDMDYHFTGAVYRDVFAFPFTVEATVEQTAQIWPVYIAEGTVQELLHIGHRMPQLTSVDWKHTGPLDAVVIEPQSAINPTYEAPVELEWMFRNAAYRIVSTDRITRLDVPTDDAAMNRLPCAILDDDNTTAVVSQTVSLLKHFGEHLRAIVSEVLAQHMLTNQPAQREADTITAHRPYVTLSNYDKIRMIFKHGGERVVSEDLHQYLTYILIKILADKFDAKRVAVDYLHTELLRFTPGAPPVAPQPYGADGTRTHWVFQMERPVRSRLDRLTANMLASIDRSTIEHLTMAQSHFGDALYQSRDNSGKPPPDDVPDGEELVMFETWSRGTMNRRLCRWYDSIITRMLLETGAHAMPRNMDGDTPLHLAIGSGNVKALRILMKYGALSFGVRSINNKSIAPDETLNRQIIDRLSLCWQPLRTVDNATGVVTYAEPTRQQIMDCFITPIVSDITTSLQRNSAYHNNIPEGIDACITIGIMIWNHRMMSNSQTVHAPTTGAVDEHTQQMSTVIARALLALQQTGCTNASAPVFHHGLLDMAIDSIQGSGDYGKPLTSEYEHIRSRRNQVKQHCRTIEQQLQLAIRARDNGDTTVNSQITDLTQQRTSLHAEIVDLETLQNKLNHFAGTLDTVITQSVHPRLMAVRNGLPYDVIEQHRLIQTAFAQDATRPLYDSYSTLWLKYLSDTAMMHRTENIGFAIINYAKIVSVPSLTLTDATPAIMEHWRAHHTNTRDIVAFMRNGLRPLPSGTVVYTDEQPEGLALVTVIYLATRATVGAAMYRSLLHVLTDHISQNSTLITQTAPTPPHVTNATAGPTASSHVAAIVSDIANLSIEGYNLQEFLLNMCLLSFVKLTLGIISNKYDPDADFNIDSMSETIVSRLQTNPYFPIPNTSNLIKQLQNTFFPFWIEVLENCISSTRGAIEGWHQYIETIVRQLELMVATIDLNTPLNAPPNMPQP